jgi:hypothetical protein
MQLELTVIQVDGSSLWISIVNLKLISKLSSKLHGYDHNLRVIILCAHFRSRGTVLCVVGERRRVLILIR